MSSESEGRSDQPPGESGIASAALREVDGVGSESSKSRASYL